MQRLYDRRRVKWSLRQVHERLDIASDMSLIHLNGDLLHKSKDSIEEHLAGINKYSSMTAQLYLEAGKKNAFFKMLFSPTFTFIKGYFLKLGFLDGYAGFVMARINAQEVFLKYSKLILLKKNKLH